MIKKPYKYCNVKLLMSHNGIGVCYYYGLNCIGKIHISKKIEIGWIMSNYINNGLIKPSILSQYD